LFLNETDETKSSFYEGVRIMNTGDFSGVLKNEILTVKEVASYLRVSRITIWRWCQKGILPASRVGRSWRIHRDDVLALLEKEKCENSEDMFIVVDNQPQTLNSFMVIDDNVST
jgi:excisionase family DNA binding protein